MVAWEAGCLGLDFCLVFDFGCAIIFIYDGA